MGLSIGVIANSTYKELPTLLRTAYGYRKLEVNLVLESEIAFAR